MIAPATAQAQPADARARKLLAAGEALFAELEYQQAIKVLVPVTRDPAASRAQRVRAWELIALSRFILGDRGGARTAFERVLDIDPGFQLRDTSGSPRIREFFDEVRADVLGGTAADVDLEHAAPRAGAAGTRSSSRSAPPAAPSAVIEIVVATARSGALSYQEAAARSIARGPLARRAQARVGPPRLRARVLRRGPRRRRRGAGPGRDPRCPAGPRDRAPAAATAGPGTAAGT